MDINSSRDKGKAEAGQTGGRPRKITKAQLEAAINGSQGRRTVIAGELQISLRTLDRYLERYPDSKQAYHDERDYLKDYCLDKALTNIEKALEDGDPATSRWVVDRLGGKYGFIPKQALTDPDGEQPYNLVVNIIVDDSKITDSSE